MTASDAKGDVRNMMRGCATIILMLLALAAVVGVSNCLATWATRGLYEAPHD